MNEYNRLCALRDTGLLDTKPEVEFDRLTRLAATALGTEIALVSLVDDDRQWFKSKQGTSVSETPREYSFCARAIGSQDVFVVLDAKQDARFSDNPLVTGEPNIAFYAGAPLITAEGHALGTLCVIDSKPRDDFGETEKQTLIDLAETVMTEINAKVQAEIIQDLNVVNEELRHRMGNMYAHVSSLVSLMSRAGGSRKEFAQRLRDRISVLAKTQSLIADYKGRSAPLSSIFESTLEPLLTDGTKERVQFYANDMDFDVTPRGAFTLTLMLNELATNALKHGALKTPDGHVEFSWTETDDVIVFQWLESSKNGSFVNGSHEGFGTQILTRIVPLDFQGEANHSVNESGLLYRLTARRDRLMEHAA